LVPIQRASAAVGFVVIKCLENRQVKPLSQFSLISMRLCALWVCF